MRCKVNDLAIISHHMPHNRDANGRVVKIIARCPHRPDAWHIEFVGEVPKSLNGYAEQYCKDSYLIPIAGDRFENKTKQDEPVCEGA